MADAEFYNRMAQTALALIESKGRSDLVLRRETASSYDPIEDTEVPGAMMEQPITCVVLPVSKGVVEAFDNRFEAGTLIEANMRLLKIAAADLAWEPRGGDVVPDLEGALWTVLGSTPMSPAGIPLVFNATVKRG